MSIFWIYLIVSVIFDIIYDQLGDGGKVLITILLTIFTICLLF
nr:MAG TPA: hypothetical protein [Caudoviricetes sp.]